MGVGVGPEWQWGAGASRVSLSLSLLLLRIAYSSASAIVIVQLLYIVYLVRVCVSAAGYQDFYFLKGAGNRNWGLPPSTKAFACLRLRGSVLCLF